MLRFSVKPKLWLVISLLTASSCTSEGLLVMICVNVCSYRFPMAQRHRRQKTNKTHSVLGMKFQIKGFDLWLGSQHELHNAAFWIGGLKSRPTTEQSWLKCRERSLKKRGLTENGISYIFILRARCFRPIMVCWSCDFTSLWWPVCVTSPVPSCNRHLNWCVTLKLAFRNSALESMS